MNRIGGFFELELSKGHYTIHENAIALSTGRACLSYIISAEGIQKVYLPYYCCDALIEPFKLKDISYEFYHINHDLEITKLPSLKEGEFIVYCNFFGIKNQYTSSLIDNYGKRLIIDNTHSFFHPSYDKGIYSFTSARKYFGVPDGAFLFGANYDKTKMLKIPRFSRFSIRHGGLSIQEDQEAAYKEYAAYEKTLNCEIERISKVSELLLSHVNFDNVRRTRNENFDLYHKELKGLNQLILRDRDGDQFCYPLLLDEPVDRTQLYAIDIFIPHLWLDTVARENRGEFGLECKLSQEILPLPIDHRYTAKEIKIVVKAIKELYHGK